MIFAWIKRVRGSDFIQKILETFVTRVLLIIVGLVTSVITARILGPERRGLLAAGVAVLMILYQFSTMGLHAANTYYVSRERSLLPLLVGNSVLIGGVVGGGASIITAIIFTLKPELAPVTGMILFWALITVPVDLTNLLLQNILLGVYDIRAFNIIQFASKISNVGLILLVVALSWVSVESLLFLNFLTAVMGLSWSVWRIKRYLTQPPHASFTLLKKHIRYGMSAYFAALFSFMVLRADLLMVKYILGAEQLGYYALAATMGDMIYMLPVTVGTILFPRLSAMSSHQEKQAFTFRIAGIFGAVMLGLIGVALLLAHPAVRFLYGDEFLPAVPAFYWLTIGLWFLSVNTIFSNYFAAIGMPPVTIYSPAFASILNVGANLYFTRRWGITGTALASTIAYASMLLVSLVYIYIMRRKRYIETIDT